MRADAANRSQHATALRALLLVAVLVSLVAGIAGGLVRAGVDVAAGAQGWLTAAVGAHAFLMICTFMGTVIGIERAVAVKHPLAFAGPAASAAAGFAVLLGNAPLAAWLVAAASLALVAVNVVVVARQRAAHTVLLLVAALAWATGSALHALAAAPAAVVPWWLAFLILTIAAERLEMTRLTRRWRGAPPLLYGVSAATLIGAALSAIDGSAGGVLYGVALAALALWLSVFDVARRTVRAPGLSRYIAVCLLLGYVWLLVGGVAWAATALGLPLRDAALHGPALGFVFSMVLAHAPVIVPAITRVKLAFGRAYYVPLGLLQLSLVVRLVGGHVELRALAAGAAGNAIAIAALAATLVGSAISWRVRQRSSPSRHA
jgi:hypothetical protein